MLKLRYSDFLLECGCDEAGRGCLAGPVTAASVCFAAEFDLNKNELFNKINDSKQLSEKLRFEIKPIIEAFIPNFAVTHIFNEEIDEINVLNASMKAMQECVLKLNPSPEFIIVDGNRPIFGKLGKLISKTGKVFSPEEITHLQSIPTKSIVKGDSQYLSIAMASILAKTYRDEYMDKIHEEFPMYNWKKNKGYPTKEHREAIAKYGITKYHRKTFRLLPEQLALEF